MVDTNLHAGTPPGNPLPVLIELEASPAALSVETEGRGHPMSNVTDPHVEWARERAALEAGVPEDEDLPDAVGYRLLELHRQILRTEAQTLGGVLVQLELLDWHFRGSEETEETEAGFENVLATLRRMV